MKIYLFGILVLMLLLSGGCHKASPPEMKPNTSTTDTVKKAVPTPFAGTWKLVYSGVNLISDVENIPQYFQEVIGKDTSTLSYDIFAQRIDTLVIHPNTWINTISLSGGSEESMYGDIRVTNSIFIFENMVITYNQSNYPMAGNYYWFITNSNSNELDLISPRFYISTDCNMDDWMEAVVLRFKRVK